MKKLGLLLIGLTFTFLTTGQTLKIQKGTSISNLTWNLYGLTNEPISPYNKPLFSYAIFAGIDYLDKPYFNLSSNIGFIRKGGKGEAFFTDENGELPNQIKTVTATLDYLSINTMIDLKYPIEETISPFVSVGPRFDYLVNNSREFYALEVNNELKNTLFGLILGGGVKYDISNLQLGLRADYYLDFTKIADYKNEETGIRGETTVNTFTINLFVGYRLN